MNSSPDSPDGHYISESESDSEDNLLWDNWELGAMSNAPTTTTQVDRTELAQVISQNGINNFSKVVGLSYFCGGSTTAPGSPQTLCVDNVIEWLNDIDSRTEVQWTDAGRIQLCKQHALGTAHMAVTNAARLYKDDWEEVKKFLTKTYSDRKPFEIKRQELNSMRRRTGETMPDFFTRLLVKALALEEQSPEDKDTIKLDTNAAFLSALPVNFRGKLVPADKKDPLAVYGKAMEYIMFNPQLKLDDDTLRREVRQSVAPVNSQPPNKSHATHSTPQPLMSQQINPPSHGTRSKFQGGRRETNHSETAVTCFRCGKKGHTSRVCRAIFCNNCSAIGHDAAACRRPARQERGNFSPRYRGNAYDQPKNFSRRWN